MMMMTVGKSLGLWWRWWDNNDNDDDDYDDDDKSDNILPTPGQAAMQCPPTL